MSTQVQVRGATQATQEARTLASREFDINTTDYRISIHNGSDPGGVPHVNWVDQQNEEFTYAAASGTNTITVTLAIAPASYSVIKRVVFKAANTNSGSATLNVNSLGAKTIKKKDVFGGTLATLDAGDIIQDGVYAAYYNGTDFILESVDSGGIETVAQGDLDSSTGSVSTTSTPYVNLTLPGGEYGFYPQVTGVGGIIIGAVLASDTISAPASFTTNITMKGNGSGGAAQAQQRYINSSPPFDLGDGEVAGFIFLLLDSSGKAIASYAANVPPWAYNGPTDIRATHKSKLTGKKYRRASQKLTIDEVLSGVRPKYEFQEITHELKNADMALIPHPFGVIPHDHKVILLDMQSDEVSRLIDYQNAGGGFDLSDALVSGKIYADNELIALRKAPRGVLHARLRFK